MPPHYANAFISRGGRDFSARGRISKIEDLMLGATELDAARQFVEKAHSLRGKRRQEAMIALLQFSIGIKVGYQFPFVRVKNGRTNGQSMCGLFFQFGELKE